MAIKILLVRYLPRVPQQAGWVTEMVSTLCQDHKGPDLLSGRTIHYHIKLLNHQQFFDRVVQGGAIVKAADRHIAHYL